jgi:hypothetical protein
VDKATELWLQRLERDGLAADRRLEAINIRVGNIERDIAEIRTAIQPRSLPVWVIEAKEIRISAAA